MTKQERQLLFDMQAAIKDRTGWTKDLETRFTSAITDTRSPELRIRLSGRQPALFD